MTAGWYLALLAVLALAPFVVPDYYRTQLIFVFIYAIVGFGLMLLAGFTGQISMGHAAFLAIGLVGWVTEARLVRGQFLSLREQEYVQAAQVAGASGGYIIRRHMLPNSLTPIIVALT